MLLKLAFFTICLNTTDMFHVRVLYTVKNAVNIIVRVNLTAVQITWDLFYKLHIAIFKY